MYNLTKSNLISSNFRSRVIREFNHKITEIGIDGILQ